jgi:hypothetical protein
MMKHDMNENQGRGRRQEGNPLTWKDWVSLLVVFVLLGVVGKMDVDDALAFEQATSTAPTSAQR